MHTAFCSYQDSTMDSGSSLTPQPKCLRQRDRNLNCTIGIVALSDIHQTRQTVDRAEVQGR